MIYDGSLNPATLQFNVINLQQGKYYSFYIIAINFNGQSQPSDEL